MLHTCCTPKAEQERIFSEAAALGAAYVRVDVELSGIFTAPDAEPDWSGLDEVMEALDKHVAWMEETGALRERRVRRAGDEIESIALQQLRAKMGDLRHGNGVDELAADVVDGKTDPYAAADQVVAALA